jgi:hypothetical protein
VEVCSDEQAGALWGCARRVVMSNACRSIVFREDPFIEECLLYLNQKKFLVISNYYYHFIFFFRVIGIRSVEILRKLGRNERVIEEK